MYEISILALGPPRQMQSGFTTSKDGAPPLLDVHVPRGGHCSARSFAMVDGSGGDASVIITAGKLVLVMVDVVLDVIVVVVVRVEHYIFYI